LNQNIRIRGFDSFENQGVRQLADDCFQNKNNDEVGHYGQTIIMVLSKVTILDYLKSNKDLFKNKFCVVRIGIFGSYARGEATEDSDIDVIVEFDENTEDLFDKKYELREFLKLNFNKNIDLCRESAIKPVFIPLILKDTIYA
jgi:predicted nucleotidyltransferase